MLSPVMLYVDDIFSVSLRRVLQRNMALADDFCRALIGFDAIANTETM
jgi:hypothetical protein